MERVAYVSIPLSYQQHEAALQPEVDQHSHLVFVGKKSKANCIKLKMKLSCIQRLIYTVYIPPVSLQPLTRPPPSSVIEL